MQAEIEDFLEGFNQPIYRGMRINGSGGHVVAPARHERVVELPRAQYDETTRKDFSLRTRS
jgi:hypothetical protein